MNTKRKHLALALAGLLPMAAASAAGPLDGNALAGYTERSPGLWVKPTEAGERLVATSAEGHAALLDTMRRDADRIAALTAKRAERTGAISAGDRVGSLVRAAEGAASAFGKASETNFGDCGNGDIPVASASADVAARTASAYAGLAIAFGPATPTANFAYADVEFQTASSSTSSTTLANASASTVLRACWAIAYGEVTQCGSAPTTAYASEFGSAPRCFL